MSGSSSAVLSGQSTPVAHTQWDHTYVTSDCGWVWRCWGGHTGGQCLARGTGNSFLANCFSKPAGTAEIIYGVSGVCHQTANRILLPARIRVAASRGYNVSFKVFGHYGRPWLPRWAAWQARLAACMASTDTSSQRSDYEGVDSQRVVGKGAAMTDDTQGTSDRGTEDSLTFDELMRYMASDGDTVDHVREMCNPHLDRPLSDEEEAALVEIQGRFEQNHQTYVSSLQSGAIARERYLDAVNSILETSMLGYKEVLGEPRFLSVFGEAGHQTDKLIDRKTFLGG